MINLNLNSQWVGWVSPDARRGVAYAANSLTPYITGVLGQLPDELNSGVRQTFEATMLYAGVWEKRCAEALTSHEYFRSFIADAGNPPELISLDYLDLDQLVQDAGQKMELFYIQSQALVKDLSDIGVSDSNLPVLMENLKQYYREFSCRLFRNATDRYSNTKLGLMVILIDELTFSPSIRCFPSKEIGFIDVCIYQEFQLKNCDEDSLVKGKIVGKINSKATLTFSLDEVHTAPEIKITFIPELIDLPEFEERNFVQNLDLSFEPTSCFLMPDGASINVADQVIKDLHRQFNYINGAEVKGCQQIVESIYALTEENPELCEKVCKCMCQATPASGAIELFKKFHTKEVSPLQSNDIPPVYRVLKTETGINLESIVFFNIYNCRDCVSKNTVKITTVVDFNTGHATIRYVLYDDNS